MMRTATEQLPAFIFYLGVGAVLLVIVAVLEAYGERVESKRRKRRKAEMRRARRSQVWAELGYPTEETN